MSSVSVTPMHPPVYVAKQAATIDVLSGGRFTLGVGVGGRDEDYRALGAPFEHRHQRLDDQVAVMQRVWAGEQAVAGVGPIGPQPVQPGGPRLLTGSMGPRSMARAAKWAAGIAGFEMGCDLGSIRASADAFSAAWVDAGRTGLPWLQSSGWFSLRPDAAEQLHEYAFSYLRIFGDDIATMLAGMQKLSSETALRENLKAIADTGLDEFILVATTADVDDAKRAADLVASLHG
jgi:alkanesulfonate monooxygenase SsuD/methylene tetrahydromethanopterin reductase-like flavin-dependent oxidoreductase (luciferase family)